MSPTTTPKDAWPSSAASIRPLVFVGGSAMLRCIEVMGKEECGSMYVVVPVTDDGGSSGEIVRKIGGPAVGDLRSAVTRLGKAGGAPRALQNFLSYRLSSDPTAARVEWCNILAQPTILRGIPEALRNIVHRYLMIFDDAIPHATFDFSNGCLGNFFLSGARLHFNCLDSGLFMLSRLWQLPVTSTVVPVLKTTNATFALGVELEGGETIIGQNNISHPSTSTTVDKSEGNGNGLSGRVIDIFFEQCGERVVPEPHEEVIKGIESSNIIVYGRGSLITSILPSLAHTPIVRAIITSTAPKIFIVNGSHDRETIINGRHLTVVNLLDSVLSLLPFPDEGGEAQREEDDEEELKKRPVTYTYSFEFSFLVLAGVLCWGFILQWLDFVMLSVGGCLVIWSVMCKEDEELSKGRKKKKKKKEESFIRLDPMRAPYFKVFTHLFIPQESLIPLGSDFTERFPLIKVVEIPCLLPTPKHPTLRRYDDAALVAELRNVVTTGPSPP